MLISVTCANKIYYSIYIVLISTRTTEIIDVLISYFLGFLASFRHETTEMADGPFLSVVSITFKSAT